MYKLKHELFLQRDWHDVMHFHIKLIDRPEPLNCYEAIRRNPPTFPNRISGQNHLIVMRQSEGILVGLFGNISQQACYQYWQLNWVFVATASESRGLGTL